MKRLILHEALKPPLNLQALLYAVPELYLSKGVEQNSNHHLDALDHTLEVVRRVESELEEQRLGASIARERVEGLRLAAALHDVAKPFCRSQVEGEVHFIGHDSSSARLAWPICQRLGLSALLTDLVVTLTALHIKIVSMTNARVDYPPDRLACAAGPFGEELAVLSWADRLAVRGPRVRWEHIERQRNLCIEFIRVSRTLGPFPTPDYKGLSKQMGLSVDADVGYTTSCLRLLAVRGMDEEAAFAYSSLVL